jgi:diaminohydroxyphosphoribosylaminopyrimidine deaminase/5-amino-6-(5-phosphoribosylamino)uracil reductase
MRVAAPGGRVDIRQALTLLATRGITRVFSEGGPSLAEALIEADCVDEFASAASRTPLGQEGVPAIGPKLAAALAERFTLVGTEDLGADELRLYERSR